MSRYLQIKLLEILGLEIFDGLWDPWDAEAMNDELKNCD